MKGFFKAEPFLCVAALLQHIVHHELGREIKQYEIADYFGVNVPFGYIGQINAFNETDDPNKWGITVNNNALNAFFKSFNIPLVEKYFPISGYTDWSFEDFLLKEINSENYIVCGFDYGFLFEGHNANNIGHVCLILTVDKSENTVQIFDPGPEQFGVKWVTAFELFCAIHKKHDGVWKISRI
jgi:hypothetical protein